MVIEVVKSPGYHTRIPDGAKAHWTRQAMDYAIANFESGEAWRVERANRIVERVLGLQVKDPLDQHFGIWGWFMEEPPAQMAPADWNWADFIGARISQILIRHGALVAPAVAIEAKEALRRAAWAIFRRNVGLGYTNIAVMGGVVSAAAGEILGDEMLVDYGRRRLRGVLDLVREAGGLSEYNSPTYTRVALEEAERGLMLVRDEGVREACEALRVIAWQTIAEHFHPGTGQSAGPQSRAYSDFVSPGFARYLSEQTGVPIRAKEELKPEDAWDEVEPIACPAEIAERFGRLPEDPHEIRHRYSANKYIDTVGTTWFTRDACIGSVTRGFGWVQQRPVLGYWARGDGSAVCVRVRVLKDGKDFASIYLWSSQRGPRVLTAVSLIRDSGDHHITLDKPAGGVFSMTDLRVRIQIEGVGVRAERAGEGRWRLWDEGGEWNAVVHVPAEGECRFEGVPIRWSAHQSKDVAGIDAVLYSGETRSLPAQTTGVRIGFGLELVRAGLAAAVEGVTAGETTEEGVTWKWGGLSVFGRTGPVAFAW
jgi:hypothetical protein